MVAVISCAKECAAQLRSEGLEDRARKRYTEGLRMSLQEELNHVRQVLHRTEQDRETALAAQLSQHEVALKSSQQDSEQKLHQALQEVAVSDISLLQASLRLLSTQ